MEFFWSVFSRIRTEYREIRSVSQYLVQMWGITSQKNSEYGHFIHSFSLRVSIDDNFGVLYFAFLFLVKLTKTYFYFESPAIPVKKLIGQSKEITQKYLAVVTKPLFLE